MSDILFKPSAFNILFLNTFTVSHPFVFYIVCNLCIVFQDVVVVKFFCFLLTAT